MKISWTRIPKRNKVTPQSDFLRDCQDLIPYQKRSYFNVNNVFVDDRFIGVDRIADANQLTAAIASRFFHARTGAEVFSARIGQVFYYADREVTLPGGSIEGRPGCCRTSPVNNRCCDCSTD